MKKFVFLSALAILALGSQNLRAAEDIDLDICVTKSPVSALIYIAQEKEFLKKHGINAKLNIVGPAKLCHEALVAGRVDIGVVVTPNIVMAGFQTPDSGVRILKKLQDSIGNYTFVRNDRGINAPEDLKGKRIGVVIGTTSHFAFLTILDRYNIKLEDVKVVPLQAAGISPALIGGQIDAAVIWYPFPIDAIKTLGANLKELDTKDRYKYLSMLATHESFLKSHSQKIDKIDSALKEAAEWVLQNREESIAITSKATGINQEILSKIWDDDVRTSYLIDQTVMEKAVADAALIKKMDIGFRDKALPDFRAIFQHTE